MTPAPDPAVLAGLRKALGGPMPLQSSTPKGKSPVEGLFPKGVPGKASAQYAHGQGWIEERMETVVTTKGTKTVSKLVSLGWVLSEAGRQYLVSVDSPRPVLEAMLPVLQRIADGLGTPPSSPGPIAFDRTVREASAACVSAIEEAFGKLHELIEAEFARVGEKLAAASKTSASHDPAAELAVLLPLIRETLGKAEVHAPTPPPVSPPPITPRPLPGPDATRAEIPPDTLRKSIKAGYDELRLYAEFRNGPVEVPRLYHEVARHLPGLTLSRFHLELEALRKERALELKVLNEVAEAKEPELAIRHDDRLYYYVTWR